MLKYATELSITQERSDAMAIKRADDYARIWEESGKNPDKLVEIARCFVLEIQEIAMARKAARNRALFAIIRELDQKWVAFARRFPEGIINESGFRKALFIFMPGLQEYEKMLWA